MASPTEETTSPKKNRITLWTAISLAFLFVIGFIGTFLTQKNRRILWTLIGIIFLIALGSIAWVQSPNDAPSRTGDNQKDIASTDIQGALFLSTIVTSTSTGEIIGVVPLMVEASSGRGAYIPFNQLKSGQTITLQFGASDNFSAVVFLGTPIADGGVTQPVPSVYYADIISAKTFEEGISLIQGATAIATPTSDDYFREFPSVSDAHVVAYASLSQTQYEQAQSQLEALPAEDWTIYTATPNGSGETQKIADGFAPKWVSDRLMAYLKNDGVYVYDLITKVERRVWSLDFVPNLATGFDISNDGLFMVVTNPGASSFVVLQSVDQKTSFFTKIAEGQRSATSPIFAPDNSHIAMFGVNTDGDTEIMYYSLAENAFLDTTLPFDSESYSGLYMTDWR